MRALIGLGLLICALTIGESAIAQVHRCTNASGQLTYSDAPCGPGQTGELVERKKTSRAIYEERVQAYEAESKKQQRYASEREQERRARSQAMQNQDSYPAQQRQKGYAERLAERNAGVTSSLTPRPQKPRRNDDEYSPSPPPMRPPPPTSMTRCDGGFCYDNHGSPYHRNGPDHLTGPNGSVCHRAGNFWNCN